MSPIPHHRRPSTARVGPRTLTLEGLTVRYGAVIAVDDVSYRLEPGTVTGLIGPNGAGKTSLIDAISGFTPARGPRAARRRRPVEGAGHRSAPSAGVARSFQSLELFEDSTVFENLSVAADPQDLRSYSATWSGRSTRRCRPRWCARSSSSGSTTTCTATSRICRTASGGCWRSPGRWRCSPSVLLLDEPAAGLSVDRERGAGPGGPPLGRRLGHGDPASSSTT